MINLLPQPALMIEGAHEQILYANPAYLHLTTFALPELQGRPLRELVADLPAPLAAGDVPRVIFQRRSRTAQPASVEIRNLDPAGTRMILLFQPVTERPDSLLDRSEPILRALASLTKMPNGETVRQGLERALAALCLSMGTTTAAIYRSEPNQVAAAWKCAEAGEAGIVPDTLSSDDLARLPQTVLWRPGRRVQNELHRAARIHNLGYLVSTPLGDYGLLVIGARQQTPPEFMTPVIEAFASAIHALVSHHMQLFDSRKQVLENRRELSIWRAVAENTQEGIVLVAPDLTVMQINTAAEWMLGYTDWEVKNQPVENIIIGPERFVPLLETARQGIPTHNMGNVSIHRRNGLSFPAHMEIMPVEREGETLAIILFFRDVSEHVEIRNRTQQLEQRAVLGEVTAVFAHEVRNPINNISTGLQLLSVKLPPDDPNQENIARLVNDCQRLNHLMESVLSFSRHAEHKFERVDLEMLLRRLLDRWRPRMSKVNVSSFFQIEEGCPAVYADPRSLEQVFTNLVGNAVEAMSSAGGTLSVRVAAHSPSQELPQVQITVADTGPGIPDDVRERIFEPFVTTKSGGTGLGLAITKRIVTAHHGSIRVNSFPGGTVFHVLLSAYQGEAE